jgi:hypothetical protein
MPIGMLAVKLIRKRACFIATIATAMSTPIAVSLAARTVYPLAELALAIAVVRTAATASATIAVRTGWPMELRRWRRARQSK